MVYTFSSSEMRSRAGGWGLGAGDTERAAVRRRSAHICAGALRVNTSELELGHPVAPTPPQCGVLPLPSHSCPTRGSPHRVREDDNDDGA
jgi:hypothetical protein